MVDIAIFSLVDVKVEIVALEIISLVNVFIPVQVWVEASPGPPPTFVLMVMLPGAVVMVIPVPGIIVFVLISVINCKLPVNGLRVGTNVSPSGPLRQYPLEQKKINANEYRNLLTMIMKLCYCRFDLEERPDLEQDFRSSWYIL